MSISNVNQVEELEVGYGLKVYGFKGTFVRL